MILAGDIGGTNTRLAVFDEHNPTAIPQFEEDFRSLDYQTLESIIDPYVKRHNLKISSICIGFAGPIRNGEAIGTNLPWILSAKALAPSLKVRDAWIINDLEANAYGIEMLSPDDFCTLNVGQRNVTGNAGLISAGTGLGEAGLVWDGTQLLPFATEGGHADFGPSDEIQIELLQYLQKQFNHVSWERVVSGMGLVSIYSFLRDTGRGSDPKELTDEIAVCGGAAISQAALSGKSELCDLTLNMFISCYGAEAGNLALKLAATGGMYIGGGIAPRIIERLKKTPQFLEAFLAKGRFDKLLSAIPIKVILNDKTALLGAARYARLNTSSQASPLPANRI